MKRFITACLVMLVAASMVFAITKNRKSLGSVKAAYSNHVLTVEAYPDNTLLILPAKGYPYFFYQQQVDFIIRVLEECLNIIDDNLYTQILFTEPKVVVSNKINGTMYTMEIFASTAYKSRGKVHLSFDEIEVALNVQNCREMIRILVTFKEVTEDMKRQREKFQLPDALYSDMERLKTEAVEISVME